MYYFAYGTNINKKIFLKRFKQSKYLRKYILKKHKVIFRSKSGLPDIKKDKKSSAKGIIYKIDSVIEKKIDKYEDYPNLYKKKYFMLKNKKIMYYIMKKKSYLSNPSNYYLKIIKSGYKQNNYKFNLY
tara:strand:- start:92 stop:475 length:384 start_codon:yes stop_codon:yes gene_type:complete